MESISKTNSKLLDMIEGDNAQKEEIYRRGYLKDCVIAKFFVYDGRFAFASDIQPIKKFIQNTLAVSHDRFQRWKV